jgi:glycosyltransferase involved in cell wall biosynthesis
MYEAFNVEKDLKEKTLSSHPHHVNLIEIVTEVEALACEIADKIICVSDEDYQKFSMKINPSKLGVVRNGVSVNNYKQTGNLDHIKSMFSGRSVAVFIGSGHPPNIEAVRFIINELAKNLPEIFFLIVGSSCDSFRWKRLPKNVLLCGVVEDEVKSILIGLADVALNPIFFGGGSSLKLAEYLAAGIPVISTEVGMGGYDLKDGIHVIKANPEEFPKSFATYLITRI